MRLALAVGDQRAKLVERFEPEVGDFQPACGGPHQALVAEEHRQPIEARMGAARRLVRPTDHFGQDGARGRADGEAVEYAMHLAASLVGAAQDATR